MSAFYSDPFVRQRLVEFMGGETLEDATAVYLTHSDGCQFQRTELRPPSDLKWFLDQDLDIARSLADRDSILLHLDVEYVNFDAPAEAYVDPWRTFDLQEPVVRVIEEELLKWGIKPLHMITGQGHHFVWRVHSDSDVARRIAALNPAPELVDACMSRVGDAWQGRIHREAQDAFAGVALVIEFLAHRIKHQAAKLTRLPVEITAVHVGPFRTKQREMISIDISEYGDPLHTRMIRMPFTNYLKPWVTGLARDLGIDQEIPKMRAIPLHEIDVRQAIKVRQVRKDVLDLARRASVRIPLQERGTDRLLNEYLASPLRRFHEHYYSTRHDPPEVWWKTYARAPIGGLPPCLRDILEWPNDRLLKPAGIQLVTRAFLAEGWHPRHIAGLIRSKFENPSFGWGLGWDDYEAGTRADFYVRLFSGLWATGVDALVDFNCTSTQEKGFCPGSHVELCTLEPLRQKLTTPTHL